MTKSSSKEDTTNVSLTLAMASRYPLLRRFDQQFALEDKFSAYQKEITRLGGMNKAALANLDYQERRLREMQASLRSSSLSMEPKIVGANDITRTREGRDACQNGVGIPDANSQLDSGVDTSKKRYSIRNNFKPGSRNAHIAVATKNVDSQASNQSKISSRKAAAGVPDAPKKIFITEIQQDSFTIRWDTTFVKETIVDYEIKYVWSSVQGQDTEVLRSCSRWCLKKPVPNGLFTVQNLEPDTQYRNIALRCRNHVGWSEFCDPIPCITTFQRDQDYENRRGKFLFRIGYIEKSIRTLEQTRDQIPAQQALLARNMSATQQRILELNEEIERVVSHEDKEILSSQLLHGASQSFTKEVLKRKLEDERVICRERIAQWRAGIIDMDKERSDLADDIRAKESQLSERTLTLHMFDRRHSIVSGIKHVVSKRPDDVKRYYIALWRSRAENRLEIRSTLNSLARSCRRRILSVSWRKLRLVDRARNGSDKQEVDGIGGVLLNAAEICMKENLAAASDLIGYHQSDEMARVDSCPTHLLCEEDKAFLTKGEFLFNAGHFESSLKCFKSVLSKMESHEYFSDMSSPDAATLYSEVNGKIGSINVRLGSFDLGIVYFGRQLSLAEEEDLQVPKTSALIGLGICYHHKYDHLYAESFFKRALDLCLSRGDKDTEVILYNHLRECSSCLNQQAAEKELRMKIQHRDNTSWDRESGGTAVSRKGVEQGLQKLDSMRLRLIDVIADKSQVLRLEVVSTHRVQLQNAKTEKEHQLRQALEQLSDARQFSEELQELEEQIVYEIDEANNTKKNRIMSTLLSGSKQNIKAAELLFRLQEELKIVRAKLEQSLAEISQTEMLIHNSKDDIKVINEEITVEGGPLMRRVLKRRNYRCISLNASNVVCDDVAGTSTNGVECVALSEGHLIHVHSLNTGKLDNVFAAGEHGAATITSLFFYGNRIYAGTMDSNVVGWSLTDSEKLFVAIGHESTVTCIYADDSKLVSGSADKSIIVWSVDGMMIRRVCGHARGVHSIQCGPSWCISASYGTLFVWDIIKEKGKDRIKEFNCQCRLVLPTANVTVLHYGELEVITGDSLGNLSVWWIESGEILQNFKVHDAPVASLQDDAIKAISSGLDMVITLSDIIQGVVLHTLRGHTAPVLAVAFDRKQIISISSDGELRYWPWESPCPGRSKKKRGLLNEQRHTAPCVDS